MALSAALAAATHVELHGQQHYAYPMLVSATGALGMLAIGLADDLLELRAVVKLGLLAIVAVGMVTAGLQPGVLGFWPGASVELPLAVTVAGSFLWLVVVTNAVNFMDGANGLSMGMAFIAALGLAACGAVIGVEHITLASIALAGGLAGFLIWNVRGLLFAGDAGALFVGAMLGGLGLDLVQLRPDLLFVPAILLLPFLSDVLS